MGEQPNPWDLLQPQDVMSRHRGAKPSRRCELLEKISLFNLLLFPTQHSTAIYFLPAQPGSNLRLQPCTTLLCWAGWQGSQGAA